MTAARKAVGCRLKAVGQKGTASAFLKFLSVRHAVQSHARASREKVPATAYSLQPTAFAQRGVTLIELVVFIVIAAIVMVAMVAAFSKTSNGMATGKMLTSATQAGQQRMEAIVAQVRYLRSTVGYSGITAANYDPCLSGWANQACASGSSNITTNADFSANVCGAGTGNNCFQVTVTAIDTNSALGSPLVLTYQVWNY